MVESVQVNFGSAYLAITGMVKESKLNNFHTKYTQIHLKLLYSWSNIARRWYSNAQCRARLMTLSGLPGSMFNLAFRKKKLTQPKARESVLHRILSREQMRQNVWSVRHTNLHCFGTYFLFSATSTVSCSYTLNNAGTGEDLSAIGCSTEYVPGEECTLGMPGVNVTRIKSAGSDYLFFIRSLLILYSIKGRLYLNLCILIWILSADCLILNLNLQFYSWNLSPWNILTVC